MQSLAHEHASAIVANNEQLSVAWGLRIALLPVSETEQLVLSPSAQDGSIVMPMQLEQGQLIAVAANILIGIGMLSIFGALLFAWGSRRQHPFGWIMLLFGAFFAASGTGRLFRGIFGTGSIASPELFADVASGILAIGIALIAWPVVLKLSKLPGYADLEVALKDKEDAYRRLEYSQRVFESFMSALPVSAWLKDTEGRFVFVNRETERMTAIPASEFLGLTNEDLTWLPQALRTENSKRDELARHSEQMVENISYLPLPTGEYRRLLIIRFPVKDECGDSFVGGLTIDITSEAMHEQLKAQFAAIVESSEDAIFSKTMDGIITSWNPGAQRLYDYEPEEIVGQSVSKLMPSERKHELREILNKIRLGEPVRDFHTIRQSKSGRLIDVAITISPMRDESGDVVGAAVVARDISSKNAAEQKIEELNTHLQTQIEQLAKANVELETARDQALEASDLKTAFVANISHELRTPLTGILGSNELLLSGETDENKVALLTMMHDSAYALLNVVNDILDLSKIEAGKITLDHERFNPSLLIEDCAKLLAPAALAKALDFEVLADPSLPRFVFGDPTRVRQILINLIGNAIKFTENGKITVRAETVREDHDRVCIGFSVTDTGIGITSDDHRLLFTPFTQLDRSTTRKFGGTGLGLAISKRFVDMMHGELGFDSEKDRGSTFWFNLPFDKQAHEGTTHLPIAKTLAPGIEPLPPDVVRDKKILIVEDNVVLRDVISRQLTSLGLQLETAASGLEAVSLGASGDFDVIFMDVNLPDVSGNEATRTIRAIETNACRNGTVIIAMTAGAMSSDRDAALEAGMDDYLSKPISVEQFKQTLSRWLSRNAAGESQTKKSA